ncbi:MAG: AmmeMemoRadiSam system protein B [Desulfomonile tiedjei]|nr:AmmeMemoRadiSam system protein B [Desulfomonile tiedjei]
MSRRTRSLPTGWYPGSADACNREIDGFLVGYTAPAGTWIGGVVPHAGWYYSGRAAARTISTLAGSGRPDRVVIYGGHLPAGRDPIAYTDEAWETPLGAQPMDPAFCGELVSSGEAVEASRGFSDNTVEVQIPLVRRFFPDIPVIAVHAPASDTAIKLGEAVQRLLSEKGLTAAFLGSADLTHYGPNYGFTPRGTGAGAVKWVKEENDRALIDKALAMDAHGLLQEAWELHNTCSAGPIASVIASVSRRGVKSGSLLEYYTSYDISPDASFVGYAAILY